jgi:hypothetical protein
MSVCRNIMRAGRYVLAAVVLASSAGCARAPYDEDISGTMTRAGKEAGSVRLRFLSSDTVQLCGQPYAEGITDDHGRFRMRLRYQPSRFESVDVVIHPYRLCVFEDGEWHSIWDLVTGPAPKRVEFQCDLGPMGKSGCEVIWEGRIVPSFGTKWKNGHALKR